jgi:hypothetical protein
MTSAHFSNISKISLKFLVRIGKYLKKSCSVYLPEQRFFNVVSIVLSNIADCTTKNPNINAGSD